MITTLMILMLLMMILKKALSVLGVIVIAALSLQDFRRMGDKDQHLLALCISLKVLFYQENNRTVIHRSLLIKYRLLMECLVTFFIMRKRVI